MKNWTEQNTQPDLPEGNRAVCREPTWGHSNKVVNVIGYCLAFAPVLTSMLNILAMAYIFKAPKLKTHTRVFLFSLGICDTLVALIVMPFRLSGLITENLKYTGELLCNLGNSMDVMLTSASMIHLCTLTFDRYVATCRPFQIGFWFRRKYAVPMFLACWTIPAILAFGFIPLNLHIGGVEFEYRCILKQTKSCQFIANTPYALLATSVCFVIPGIFILICNRHTLTAIEKRRRVFIKLLQVHTKRGSFHRRHIGKALSRTIMTLNVCFFGCWLPYFVINIVNPLICYKVPEYIWIAFSWFGYANSAINPVIYLRLTGVLSARFTSVTK